MTSLMNLPAGLLAQFGLPQADPTQAPPNVPPMLNKMTGRPAPPPAIAMGPGGMNLNPPPPPAPGVAPGMNIPSAPMPRGAAFGPASAPPPQSSDDPGITGMPALPTPPDISKSPVGPASAQFQADSAKVKAYGPAPSPQDFKPSVGRRIGGGLLGALGGGLASLAGDPNAAKDGAAEGGAFTNRKFNNATGNYQRGMAAAQKAVDLDKEGLPFAEAAGKLPQQDFDNKMKGAEEKRLQQTASATISSKDALSDIRQQVADMTAENYKTKSAQAEKSLQEKYDALAQSGAIDKEKMALQQQLAEMHNQVLQNQLNFQQQKLSTVTDARTLDQQEKEDIAATEKKYSTGVSGAWNRLVGNKEQEIAATHKMYQDRRAALGIGGTPGGGGQISVTDPRGHIHTFPNQQQADSFKRQAGIK